MEKIKGQLESYKEQPFSLVLRFLMWIATFLTVGRKWLFFVTFQLIINLCCSTLQRRSGQ